MNPNSSKQPVETPLTDREIGRGIQLQAAAEYRRQATAVEKELKGFFVDWAFAKLNLTQYR